MFCSFSEPPWLLIESSHQHANDSCPRNPCEKRDYEDRSNLLIFLPYPPLSTHLQASLESRVSVSKAQDFLYRCPEFSSFFVDLLLPQLISINILTFAIQTSKLFLDFSDSVFAFYQLSLKIDLLHSSESQQAGCLK